MKYRQQALDLMEKFHGWDDPLALDSLIEQVRQVLAAAQREAADHHRQYLDISVQVLHLGDLLEYLQRERQWLVQKEGNAT